MSKDKRNILKKMMALMLCLCMALSPLLSPIAVEAETVKMYEKDKKTASTLERSKYKEGKEIAFDSDVVVNPLYAKDVNAEQAAKRHAKSIAAMQQEAQTVEEDYLTYDEAIAAFRENMKNRANKFTLNIRFTDSSLKTADDFEAHFHNKMFQDALAHTGVSNEGDYLRWNWMSYGFELSGNASEEAHEMKYIVSMEYMTTAAEEAEVTEAVEYVLDALEVDTLDNYDTIGYIYDFICQNVVYDHDSVSYEGDTPPTSYKHAHCAYGAIINGLAVCQGYASLFYRMLLECGIDTRLVAGGNHGWNIVELDGIYYDCDTTWDAGATDYYYYFMEGSSWFRFDESHLGYPEYRTKEFTNEYPVSPLAYYIVNEGIIETSSGQCGPNTTWELDENGVLTISGTGIIESYDNENYTFWDGYEGWIKKIVIEEGITSISDYAFYNCSALEEVVLPDTLEYLGAYAFTLCDRLKEMIIPASVTEIGEGAFWICVNMDNIKFMGKAPVFGDYVFADIVTTAHYPADDESWTSSVRGQYEGTVTWKPYEKSCDEIGHSFVEDKVVWSDTYESCELIYKCERCNETKVYRDDNIDVTIANEATCTEAGQKVYEAVFELEDGTEKKESYEETIPATGHDYSEPEFTWTGNEECQAVFTCSFEGCGHTETVNCNIQEDKVEPTCTKDGYVGYVATCEFNEKEYKAVKESESIPATGHTYDKEHPEWKWNEDKTEAAVLFYCTGCDETATVVDAQIDFVTTEPTCIEEGLTVYTASCEFEGKEYIDTKEEIIPIVEHNYECSFDWTEDYSACMATYTCLVCGETKTEDCNITSDTTIVDCTTPVIITYTATTSDGNTDVKIAEGEVLGHVYGEPAFAWDGNECTITIECTRCDFTKTDDCEVEPKTVDATCTTEGSVGYVATYEFEGKIYTNPRSDAEILPALGHDYVAEPTWTWSNDKTKATAVFPCDRCEEMTTVGVTAVPTTTPATCTEAGKTVYTATVTVPNGTKEYTATEEVVIPATGHSYKATFSWSDDLEECTATITCSGCDVKTTEKCTVTEKDGVYTATCEYEGQTFEDKKSIELPFADVKEGLWYYEPIQFVYLRGIMTGQGDGTNFGPNDKLSRAQFATILYRLEGEPPVEYEAKFPDVPDNKWYTDGVMWAQENDIVTGYDTDGTFRPSNNITREQMALMMHRYAEFKEYDTSKAADFDDFPDGSKVSPWAKDAMEWAVGNGIITGKDKPEGKFLDPQGEASRAECATIIQRFMELYEK